jgi:hypothetical protein
MKIESISLQQFIDKYFEQPHARIYEHPEIPYWIGNKVDVWDIVGLPGALAIYRRSHYKNWDEGYGGNKPVLVILKKPEYTNQTF